MDGGNRASLLGQPYERNFKVTDRMDARFPPSAGCSINLEPSTLHPNLIILGNPRDSCKILESCVSVSKRIKVTQLVFRSPDALSHEAPIESRQMSQTGCCSLVNMS